MIKRDPESNKCLLKVLLISIIQDTVKEINNKSVIVKVLIKDYVSQNNSFIVKIMKVIQEDLYIYAIETCYIDACFIDKKKISNLNNSELHKSVWSKLLTVY
ncbi:10266_t:CDS:2 [Cetraspora pellucida]|uniref:10266_t:CDS:1 n=1 Tax=Cetraspora pellucida TaxID=1433469 RepID=A0ACA9K988_9GLOM|nr:10266_t:CDS:2 [Cetraspora pellucida]